MRYFWPAGIVSSPYSYTDFDQKAISSRCQGIGSKTVPERLSKAMASFYERLVDREAEGSSGLDSKKQWLLALNRLTTLYSLCYRVV